MHSAYVAIGGNLGDRLGVLAEATRRLHRMPHLRVVAASCVYETKPHGPPQQSDYLNAVLRVVTSLSPHELLKECLRVETSLGRVRRERWGARTIDLDILIYDGVALHEPTLTLPHPRMLERNFVLVPLADIAPDLALGGTSVRMLAGRLGSTGLRKLGPLEWMEESTDSPADAGPEH